MKGLRNNNDLDDPDNLNENTPDYVRGSLNLVKNDQKGPKLTQITKSNTFTLYYN